ncbi:MAG: T9SS type A sorting domain-containing protein [Flavobacteriales bacterium]
MKSIIYISLFITGWFGLPAQTVLINPATVGGFEGGSGFAANGWVEVNGAQTNRWYCVTPANPAIPFAGNNCAYISNNHPGGTTYNYNVSNTSVVHFYRDYTIPAGEPYITLTFYIKVQGEGCCDYLRVYDTPTTFTPVVGTLPASGQIGSYNMLGTGWVQQTIQICGTPGQTRRLIFSWRNDNSIGTQPPAAIDNISLVSNSIAPPCNLGTGVTNVAALPYASGAGTTCGAVNDLTTANTLICGSSLYLGGEDRVWVFTPTTTGTITINLSSGGAYTGLMVYDGCPLSNSCNTGGGSVCCVASSTSSTGNKTVSFCASANKTYYVVLDSWPAPACNAYSNLTISAPVAGCVTNQDCAGGVTVCDDQSFPGNSSGIGCVDELNASNSGCMGIEHQSSWYLFSPSSSGNVALTISPGTGVDYDFAIWGPYPSGSTAASICPPIGTPIRCSYASGFATNTQTGSYNTGIGHPTYSVPQFAAPTPGYADGTGNTLNGWVPGIQVTAGEVYVLVIDNFSANATPFVLDWTLSNGASLDCALLPIEFINFDGKSYDRKNILEWSTATEYQLSHFVIERSTNGVNFETIGQMQASGSSNIQLGYAYIDHKPNSNINYYRLLSIGFGGEENYSKTIALETKTHFSSLEVLIYPNPTNNHSAIELNSKFAEEITLRLTDAFGKHIRTEKTAIEKGKSTINLDIEQLSQGVYFLQIQSSDLNHNSSHKIMKN